MATPAPVLTSLPAALQLEGRIIKGRWKVDSAVVPPIGATGGRHSICYFVTDLTTGNKAFLKAIDYTTAFQIAAANGTMAATEIANLTSRFNFEKELLESCRDATLLHVVVILDAGTELIAGTVPNHIPNVDYLIFEHAETSVRNIIIGKSLQLTEVLLICRQCAVALQELHRHGIFHQDVKPSNLLLFPSDDKYRSKLKIINTVKLGDLGRASHARKSGPYDGLIYPGDILYMPFDLHYNGSIGLSSDRRMIDGYSLGCVFYNLITGQSYIEIIANQLHPHHTPVNMGGRWGGLYMDIKGYIDAAHARAMVIAHDYLATMKVPAAFIDEILIVLGQLLDTDPKKRGHPKNRKVNISPCDMERYISQFNHLINRAFIWGI